jgi:exonuclease VII small subunit
MSRDEDVDISEKIDRLEDIVETFEHGDIGLEHVKELREEADQHLEVLGEALDVGDGDIIKVAHREHTSDK